MTDNIIMENIYFNKLLTRPDVSVQLEDILQIDEDIKEEGSGVLPIKCTTDESKQLVCDFLHENKKYFSENGNMITLLLEESDVKSISTPTKIIIEEVDNVDENKEDSEGGEVENEDDENDEDEDEDSDDENDEDEDSDEENDEDSDDEEVESGEVDIKCDIDCKCINCDALLHESKDCNCKVDCKCINCTLSNH